MDDGGAMNAHQLCATQRLGDLADPGTHQVGFAADMELDMVPAGFYPVNFSGVQEKQPPASLDRHPLTRCLRNPLFNRMEPLNSQRRWLVRCRAGVMRGCATLL